MEIIEHTKTDVNDPIIPEDVIALAMVHLQNLDPHWMIEYGVRGEIVMPPDFTHENDDFDVKIVGLQYTTISVSTLAVRGHYLMNSNWEVLQILKEAIKAAFDAVKIPVETKAGFTRERGQFLDITYTCRATGE